jgi:hypothetical protein
MPSEQVMAKVDQVVPAGVTHIGFALRDLEGRLAIERRKHSPYGITATFPRARIQPGEKPSSALNRCLSERIGHSAAFAFPVSSIWVTPNSTTFYFAGCITPSSPELISPELKHGMRWYSPDDATRLIEESLYGPTKQRDLGVLDRVQKMCLSPYRRVLEMVMELHCLGYERLRAPAYMYPLAWRCPVVPASWTLREHGGLFHSPQSDNGLVPHEGYVGYSASANQDLLFRDFPLRNLEFASPRELTEGFLRLRPAIALAGWGPDPEYVDWLQKTLDLLKPYGLYYSGGEYQSPRDTLYTVFSRIDAVPLPPPGHSTEAEWEVFEKKYGQE